MLINYNELNHSTSKYIGVTWHTAAKKWRACVCIKKKKLEGGKYKNELDAAKRVNQMCDELGIERKNPKVNGLLPTPKVTKTV